MIVHQFIFNPIFYHIWIHKGCFLRENKVAYLTVSIFQTSSQIGLIFASNLKSGRYKRSNCTSEFNCNVICINLNVWNLENQNTIMQPQWNVFSFYFHLIFEWSTTLKHIISNNHALSTIFRVSNAPMIIWSWERENEDRKQNEKRF